MIDFSFETGVPIKSGKLLDNMDNVRVDILKGKDLRIRIWNDEKWIDFTTSESVSIKEVLRKIIIDIK